MKHAGVQIPDSPDGVFRHCANWTLAPPVYWNLNLLSLSLSRTIVTGLRNVFSYFCGFVEEFLSETAKETKLYSKDNNLGNKTKKGY